MIKKYLPATILVMLLLFMWETIARSMNVAYILPSPTQIMIRLWELREQLMMHHLPPTLIVIISGILFSVLIGMLFAILIHQSNVMEQALYPLIIASQTIPVIALAPIFIMLFGYSIWGKIWMTILITFFPITIGMIDGLKSRDKQTEELLQTMGASKRQIFRLLYIPSMLPHFLSSLKIAAPLSVVGAAIGEWLGAQAGLGYFSRRMMTQFDGAAIFAPIILLSFIGMTLFMIIVCIEKILLKWRE